MSEFIVNFSGVYPEWGDVRLQAVTPEEARNQAIPLIIEHYPDLENISIDKVEQVNG